jgi:tetratricopeptide (TPR) repeat protein
MPAVGQGVFLAELPRHFHTQRKSFQTWSDSYQRPQAECLAHFRRALIGWYEARIQPENPYQGDIFNYIQAVSDLYLQGNMASALAAADQRPLGLLEAGLQNPLDYLPRPIRLSETQQLMLRQFQEMGKNCRDLMLMAEYHRLNNARMAQVMDIEDQVIEIESRRRKCQIMAREGWQAAGIVDPMFIPSPGDEALIDRYFLGQLAMGERWEVEARRPGDDVFRRAMEIREDWAEVLIVAGRQDLMETLLREEGRYTVVKTSAPAQPGTSSAKSVKLSPRRRNGIKIGTLELPSLQTLVAVGLFLAFAWLVWDTFGGGSPQRKYVAHFEPFPNVFERRAPRDAMEKDLKDILYYYDRQDYRSAYEELLPVAQAYPAAPLYLGVCALALEQPNRALEWFEQIPTNGYYHPFSEWYEALAFLAEGRRPAALTILSDISATPNHPYRTKAERLLDELT